MAKEYSTGFYNSKAWINTRDAFMQSKNFICERCGSPGKIAHHKSYITPLNINNPVVTLNWDNLECLCQECHNQEHSRKPATAKGLVFDSNGNLKPVQ